MCFTTINNVRWASERKTEQEKSATVDCFSEPRVHGGVKLHTHRHMNIPSSYSHRFDLRLLTISQLLDEGFLVQLNHTLTELFERMLIKSTLSH